MLKQQQANGKQSGVTENLNDIELPKESSKSIKKAIVKAQSIKGHTQKVETLMKELAAYQMSNDHDKKSSKMNEIHYLQCEMQQRVLEVRLEFYKMIRKVLVSYTSQNLLMDFKGAKRESRHMTNFMRWQSKRDVFQLIKKKEFKHEARSLDD